MNTKTNITRRKIAIQGIAGAFHEIAAKSYFDSNQIEIVPSHTFEDLVSFTEHEQRADLAIMAIENSIAGSLMNNYRLLNESTLKITGEVFLRIKHQLLILPGDRLADLKEVHSHPMAIAQCRTFFKSHPQIRLIESLDTAMSAKELSDYKNFGRGVIASKLAGRSYGLEIAAPNIETNKQNFTRFLILERNTNPLENKDFEKVSICFSAMHEVGSLLKALNILEVNQANLTKIQSTPIVGHKWQYRFFIDFTIPKPHVLPSLIDVLKK